jgi:CubicO group peptidase (beta-lactamase class C family)
MKLWLWFSVIACVLLAPPVQAQTPVRRAAERVADALAGERDAREALVRQGFAPHMFEATTSEQWIALLDSAAAASGGVEIVSSAPAETERFGEFIVRARSAPRFAWLVLGVSRADPERISTLFLLPARDPQRARADAWPPARVEPRRLRTEIARRVDNLAREDFFSGAVLVARNGRIVFERYAGLADRATGAANGRATRFNVASMGKMFAAAAVGRLLEQGRLSLDDTVGRWIPEYPEDAGRRITIAQLLSHTSGLGDFFGSAYRAAPQSYQTSVSYLPLIAEAPQFEPGARFSYSNAGYALLGAIVERAAGEDFFHFVQREVFDRAGMGDAGFPTLAEREPHRAVGYFRPAEDVFGVGPRQSNENAIAFRGNAAGGAYATARDMLAFSHALMSRRLLSPETTALLLEPRNDFLGTRTPTRYGYGFSTHSCSGRAFVGHGGGGPQSGVDSVLLASADGEWTIVVLSNYDPTPDDFAQGLCEFLARQ